MQSWLIVCSRSASGRAKRISSWYDANGELPKRKREKKKKTKKNKSNANIEDTAHWTGAHGGDGGHKTAVETGCESIIHAQTITHTGVRSEDSYTNTANSEPSACALPLCASPSISSPRRHAAFLHVSARLLSLTAIAVGLNLALLGSSCISSAKSGAGCGCHQGGIRNTGTYPCHAQFVSNPFSILYAVAALFHDSLYPLTGLISVNFPFYRSLAISPRFSVHLAWSHTHSRTLSSAAC